MRTIAELKQRLKLYPGIQYIYRPYGYIAWQVGTGENVEIMFIEVKEQERGFGRKLIKEMLTKIEPYNSVYVFRLEENIGAGKFYRALGFKELRVLGLYTQPGMLGVANYKTLCAKLSTR